MESSSRVQQSGLGLNGPADELRKHTATELRDKLRSAKVLMPLSLLALGRFVLLAILRLQVGVCDKGQASQD